MLNTQNKPVAVITSNIEFALNHLGSLGHIIVDININHFLARDIKGNEYIFIRNSNQARGREFSSVIISPDFDDVVAEVKSRIR